MAFRISVMRDAGILPAGAGMGWNLDGSNERIWKQRNTVSFGRPVSAAVARTFVG
jgi:hypothetical protein